MHINRGMQKDKAADLVIKSYLNWVKTPSSTALFIHVHSLQIKYNFTTKSNAKFFAYHGEAKCAFNFEVRKKVKKKDKNEKNDDILIRV